MQSHLNEAESDIILSNILVRAREEGRRRDALQFPVPGQPLDKPEVFWLTQISSNINLPTKVAAEINA